MSIDAVIIAFPFVPLLLATISLAAQAWFRRDVSLGALRVSHLLQGAMAVLLVTRFLPAEAVRIVPLSPLGYPIVYAMDRVRSFFLLAYLVPLVLSLFRLHRIPGPHLRVLLLFYLGGCSGVIVAGDLFNFFVTYELMIMAAYVLIGAQRQFYASVKYMLFGAISSSLFLAGIVVLYASGAYLGFGVMERAAELPPGNLSWMLVLFATAFFVKAAFFPASAWVATCHSATISAVSAFLGSFTIFSGIFGLYHLVIVPATLAGYAPFLTWIRVISLLTLLAPALFLFFEPDLKRCVAGSTVYTIGLIGLLLAHGHTEAGLTYMVVHAIYKSVMFYLLDDVNAEHRVIRGRRRILICGGICVLFTAGSFPAVTYFLKADLLAAHPGYRLAFLASMIGVAGGFLKFKFRRDAHRPTENGILATAALLLSAALWLLPGFGQPSIAAALRDLTLLTGVWFFAGTIARRLPQCAGLDRRWVFPTLNDELMAVLLLLASGVAVVLLFRP